MKAILPSVTEWELLKHTTTFQLFTHAQNRLEVVTDFLEPLLLPKVRCKIIGCLKMQEHQLLLEVGFVAAVTVFKDEHFEQLYLEWL